MLETREDSLTRRWDLESGTYVGSGRKLEGASSGGKWDCGGKPGFGDWAEHEQPSGDVGGVHETHRRSTVGCQGR